MKHLVLLGDSIFDNKSYVGGGKDTIANLREQIPDDWTATLLAVDGSVAESVVRQLPNVPADATHLFVSVGGNDALAEIGILQMSASSARDVFNELSDIAARFEDRYKRMLNSVRELNKPTAVCTIYYPRYPDPAMQKIAVAALATFNDVITRQAFLSGVPLIDLRYVCDEVSDYANPIEPSEVGGAKIARTILRVVDEHNYGEGKTSVYSGSDSVVSDEKKYGGRRKVSETAETWLDSMQNTVDWLHDFMRDAMEPSPNDLFGNAVSKVFALLSLEGFLVEVDMDVWADDAQKLEDPEELKNAGLLTLRGALSYYAQVRHDPDEHSRFWQLAEEGYFLAILRRLQEILKGSRTTQQPIVVQSENEWGGSMADPGRHHMLYWQERSVQEQAANDEPLDVVASNGLFGVEPGDTLWIVTLTQEREFLLAGRLVVGEIVEHEEAIRRIPDPGLWQAEYYAFPEAGTEEFLRPVPITEVAERLRFEGENDRLRLRDGRINPQQIRKRRELTRESAELISEIWEESAEITDPEELVAAWGQIVAEHPDDPQTRYNFAVALENVGRTGEAFLEYQETIRLDPDYFPALYNLGNHHLHAQQFHKAIEFFNRAILVDGDYAPAHFMLGVAYFESGRFDEAVAATRQGLEVDPDDEGARYNIAYWTFRRGRHREALALCDDVIARFPYYTSPHVLKGMCYRELGELDNEIRSYRNAVDIKVDDEGAFIINFTALFFLGAAWERKITGRDEGIEYVEADNHFDLQDPTHQFCFAMGHLALGNREYADQFIAELRTTAPDFARRLESALEHMAPSSPDTDPAGFDPLGDAGTHDAPAQWPVPAGGRAGEVEPIKPVRNSKPRTEIRMNVGGMEIVARHNPDLFFQVLKMLVERGALDGLELPIASGRKRNLLSSSPVHKDGSPFLAPVEFGGYYMESHSSRDQGMRMLRALLGELGIESSVPDEGCTGGEPARGAAIASHRERIVGSLLGLAVCDALGTTAEFKGGGTFPEITAMAGGGPFKLNPGEWTDDTSMALCLAESLAESGGFDARDQMERYLRWSNEGHLSSNGVAFDIGSTIRTALEKYEKQTGEKNPYCGSISPASAGNGSLMRLAPVALYFAGDPLRAIAMAAESSRTTHGARECVDACRYFAGLIVGAVQGRSKDELLSPAFSPVPGLWGAEPLSERIAELANGAFKSRRPPQLTSTSQGYVVLSLHAALWAFQNSRTFGEGALKVVNLGYDSDTYGAIYGQLAGAFYGSGSIPTEWMETLAKRELIEQLAVRLIADREFLDSAH